MNAAVELRDVFRVYSTPEGDAAALQGLSLTVRERETLAILGPSGSGKTTLLRILAGLDRPSAGTVRAFGRELGKLGARELAAYRSATLGYAEQRYGEALASELSAWQLVALPLGLRGVPRREREGRADELLERVGLLDRRNSSPDELSGGERQRVVVCAALAHRPRLLLADEPTAELDGANARRLFELIGELSHAEGCAAVVVTHDPQVAAVVDRTLRIRDGRAAGESVREGRGDEEVIVVGRGGWLRLPEEYLLRAGIRTRATARFEDDRIVVEPPAAEPASEPAAESAPAPRSDGRAASGVVVQARSLSRTYGRGHAARTVLNGLDASFAAGRLYAVTGPSGSGKTTLLQLLAGTDVPTSGGVELLGAPLSMLDRERRAVRRAAHVAVIGQEPGLIPFFSARENVELALALRGIRTGDAAPRALDALAAVGLTERTEQRVARLSSGERERVAIARALAPRPALLLADEPTAHLDTANALAVAALLGRLAREHGLAIVCATHDALVLEQADEELSLAPPAAAARPVLA